MNLTARTGQLLRQSLSIAAIEESQALGGGRVNRGDVIFRSMQNAMATLVRIPVKDGPTGYRSFWPGLIRLPEERLEAYRQLVFLVLSGRASEDDLITPPPVSVEEQARMDTVLELFPKLAIGRNAERDWRIVSLLAAGLGFRQVARKIGGRKLTRQAIFDRKKVQCAAIGKRLSHLMPQYLLEPL